MGNLWQDLRFGFRMLAKTPGVTAIAILTLALGIGANTAIFSLTDQILLRALPVSHPEQLVVLRSPGPFSGSTWADGDSAMSFSYPMYKDLRDHVPAFSGLIAKFSVDLSVAGQGRTERTQGELVSGNYFQVLGVRSVLGRVLSADDETAPGANPVMVLSYPYWMRQYGGDAGILNKQLSVNGTDLTVVGVAQPGFYGVQVGSVPDMFIPVTMKAQMTPNWNGLPDHSTRWLAILGRLKSGDTRERAQGAAQPSYRALLESEWPLLKMDKDDHDKFVARQLILDVGEHGRPILQRDASQPLWFLMAMVGVVLLIACTNLASLLVARAEARQREIAIRLAIGAGRKRLIRQLLTESLLLALAGGAAGLLVGYWTLSFMVESFPPDIGILGIDANLDLRVLAFSLGLSLLTGLLFGLAPAMRATRPDVQTLLKDQAAGGSGGVGGVRLRKGLIIAQVALTAVLLAGAGLFTRSLINLEKLDLGLRTDHVLQFSIAPELNKYNPAQTSAMFDRIRERIAQIPGVHSAGVSELSILAGNNTDGNITVEGYTPKTKELLEVNENFVGPDYFATMSIPLISGREFNLGDTLAAKKVAIINGTFARLYFAGRNPIGAHFAFGSGNNVHPDIEIVGVASDSKYSDLRDKAVAFAYLPYTQDKKMGSATVYVRAVQDPTSLAGPVREAVAGIDPSIPVYGLKTLAEQVNETMFSDRFVTALSLATGLLAALLAAVGLYGVMAYVVARRTREIGIRIALGATRENIGWLVLREVLRMTAIGVVIGLPAAFGVGWLAQSLLFGVKASDPIVFAATVILLFVVALLASSLPVRKAARVDPMVALRYE
jgi:putative ABC transport system permease protein